MVGVKARYSNSGWRESSKNLWLFWSKFMKNCLAQESFGSLKKQYHRWCEKKMCNLIKLFDVMTQNSLLKILYVNTLLVSKFSLTHYQRIFSYLIVQEQISFFLKVNVNVLSFDFSPTISTEIPCFSVFGFGPFKPTFSFMKPMKDNLKLQITRK